MKLGTRYQNKEFLVENIVEFTTNCWNSYISFYQIKIKIKSLRYNYFFLTFDEIIVPFIHAANVKLKI